VVLESEQQVDALREQKGLANDLFMEGGPYLEVLDSDRQLFDFRTEINPGSATSSWPSSPSTGPWAAAGKLRFPCPKTKS